MKINKIYISAFGGLKDFTLELGDGFNVIHGQNEDGKTTVMAFIKAMFYGTGGKVKSLENSIRARYTPWDNSAMGGRIYFTADGIDYILEREFRRSDSTDRVILTNSLSGESETVESDIGLRFLGLSADGFEKSVFISSFVSGLAESDAVGELNSKLSNLAVTGDETVSYQSVANRIIGAREKFISKSGRTGSYVKGMETLKALNESYENSKIAAKRQLEISEAIAIKSEKLSKAEKRLKVVKSLLDSKDDTQKLQKLKEYLELKEKLEQLKKRFLADDGKEINFKSLEFCKAKSELANQKANTLMADIEKIEQEIKISSTINAEDAAKQIEDLKNKIAKLEQSADSLANEIELKNAESENLKVKYEQSKTAKKAFNPLFLILGGVTAVIGAVLFAVSLIPAVAVLALGIILLILSFVLRPQNKTLTASLQSELTAVLNQIAELREKKNSATSEITAHSGKMNLLAAALNTDNALKAKREADLKEKQEAFAEAINEKNAAIDKLNSIIGKYCDVNNEQSVNETLKSISENAEEINRIKVALNILSRDLDGISYEAAAEKIKALENKVEDKNLDFDALKTESENLSSIILELGSQITAGETELKTAFRSFENPETLKREINLLSEDLTAKKDFCDAAEIANEILYESFLEVRKGYGAEVEKKTLEIFSRLTNNRYSAVNVSKELDITVEKSGIFGTREIGYLSRGTVDQAYLSLRLAIAELICEDEKLPILLDDVLSQYDDERTLEALKFLKEYSKTSQIVLFTCHNSITETTKSLEIETKSLRG